MTLVREDRGSHMKDPGEFVVVALAWLAHPALLSFGPKTSDRGANLDRTRQTGKIAEFDQPLIGTIFRGYVKDIATGH